MGTYINHYVNEINNLYNGEPWLDVTIGNMIKNADENAAFIKPMQNSHSAAEIVCHIIAWREFLLSRLTGNIEFEVDQEKSFDTSKYSDTKNSTWNNIRDALEKNNVKLVSVLEALNDDELEKDVFNRDFKLKFLLDGIIQHDAYHLGQLALLLK